MTTYELAQSWLRGGKALFPPLDGAGNSVLSEGADTIVFLHVEPDPGEGPGAVEDPLYLYMPLLSLTGADEATQLAFLRLLCERNAPGSLPTGYRLWATEEDAAVYLVGQFSPKGMDGTDFASLADRFVRFGRVSRTRFTESLRDIAPPPAAPAPSDSFDIAARRDAPLRA